MTKFLLGGAALAALVAIAPATAQPVQAPMVQRAPVAQVHTRAQVAAHVATMFQRLDTNRDGVITRAESQVAKANRGARKMQRTANRSPEQRAARRAAAFDRMDANRNGSISRDEFARASAVRQQRMAAGGVQNRRLRQPGAPAMHRMGGTGMGMAGLRGHMFDMADVNRDGRVTMAEATAAAYRHFDMADANRDGQVTREERMQVRQHMRAQRQPG
jgi:Ca2+-binding EF-hand superfamily protein